MHTHRPHRRHQSRLEAVFVPSTEYKSLFLFFRRLQQRTPFHFHLLSLCPVLTFLVTALSLLRILLTLEFRRFATVLTTCLPFLNLLRLQHLCNLYAGGFHCHLILLINPRLINTSGATSHTFCSSELEQSIPQGLWERLHVAVTGANGIQRPERLQQHSIR